MVSVSQGTLDEALAHPREVFRPVIAFSAYAFIVVHNHPSGDPFPFRSVEEGARDRDEALRGLAAAACQDVFPGEKSDLCGIAEKTS